MKILIATGIYPPDIGGPAQYARNLYETWKNQGHDVKVAAYRWERAFPPLVRHFLYFLKVIRKGFGCDMILILDTWLAAVPAMFACALIGKRYIILSGSDVLWESYVERTGDMVSMDGFYEQKLGSLSAKERLILDLGGRAMRKAARALFSTDYQKMIFTKAYKLDPARAGVVEHYCGRCDGAPAPENRVFVAGARLMRTKNSEMIKTAFSEAREEVRKKGLPDIEIDFGKAVYDSFCEKIRRSYAVISLSLGDPSPGTIWDSVSAGVPFIMSSRNGVSGRLGRIALTAEPSDKKQLIEKIVWLSDPENRKLQSQKMRSFDFVNTWKDIAQKIEEANSRT